MKNQLIGLFSLFIVANFFCISCKGERKNATTAAQAVKVEKTKDPVQSVTYVVDTALSQIDWVGKNPAEAHTGTIKLAKGNLTMDTDKVTGGSFVMDMNTITVTDLDVQKGKVTLEQHLKGSKKENEDHFFNVKKFPTAAFEITNLVTKNGKLELSGNLTIKGITKNISFPVTTTVTENELRLKSESFTIDRTQWKVNYASKSIFGNLGDKFINDDIEIKLHIIAKQSEV